MLASLSHPNVATLYGFERASVGGDRPAGTPAASAAVGRAAGEPATAGERPEVPFLVMELVPGETLADRIGRGPLPAKEAIALFVQVAEGLEAAHEKGIIHRDLKPANVKVSARGHVKILDFGLAKAMLPEAPAGPEQGLSLSPTLTLAATRRGEILGTAAYMAPEQAKGGAVDKRVDIWAFGCCLWEALTGERAFSGTDIADTLAAVLRDTPDWERADSLAPPAIRRLLRRCLEKDPHRRLRDVGDARLELRDALDDPAPGESRAAELPASPRRVRVRLALAVALGLAAGLALATLMAPRNDGPPPQPPVRLSVTGENGRGFERLRDLALSRDGRQLAFVAESRLHLRRIADFSSQSLPGTEGAQIPAFSPDGEWIAFFQGTALKKVATQGGLPVKICDVGIPRGADWGDDGRIVFSTLDANELLVVPAVGGPPSAYHPAVADGENTPAHRWSPGSPELLPGGRTVLAEEARAPTSVSSVIAIDVATGRRSMLLEDARRPQVVATGHLLFLRDDDLMAVPFDAEAVGITGTPVPVARGVSRYAAAGDLLVTVAAETQRLATLVRVDREGNETPFDMPPASYLENDLTGHI